MKSLYTCLFICLAVSFNLAGQNTPVANCDAGSAIAFEDADEIIEANLPLRVDQTQSYCFSTFDDRFVLLFGGDIATLTLSSSETVLPVRITITTIEASGNTTEVLENSGDQFTISPNMILHLSFEGLTMGMATVDIAPTPLVAAFFPPQQLDFTVERALPVTWQQPLRVSNTGKLNQFNWSVSDQRDVANYELQRESNGDFTTVRTIDVIEGGSGEIAYSTTDELHTEDAYYRVKQTDFDGGSSYSNTISVPGTVAEASLLVYPNPARNLVSYNYGGELSAVSLVNLVGAQVRSLTAPAARGDFDVSDLPSGIYILSAIGTDGSRQARRVRVAR